MTAPGDSIITDSRTA